MSRLVLTIQNEIIEEANSREADEEEMEVIEHYCSFFGCGRELTLRESLCGDRCIRHQKFAEDIFNNVSI